MRFHHLALTASVILLAVCRIAAPPPSAFASGAPRDTIEAGDCYITSSTECFLRADATGGISSQMAANKGTISPSGRGPSEDIHLRVTIRNVLGAPLAGATVVATATATSGAVFRWDDGSLPPGDTAENPQTAVTDASGVVELIYDEGGVMLQPSPSLPNLDFAVTSQGPGPGGPVALAGCATRFSLLSFDLNADGRVDLTDFAIFSTDYVAGNPRSDFTWADGVNLADLAAFTAHYRAGASLDGQ